MTLLLNHADQHEDGRKAFDRWPYVSACPGPARGAAEPREARSAATQPLTSSIM